MCEEEVGKCQGPCTTIAAHSFSGDEWNLLFPRKSVMDLLQKWEQKKEGKNHTFVPLQSLAQQTVGLLEIYKNNGDLVIKEGIFIIVNCCSCPNYL